MKKHIPNILTLINLFSGCLAIVFLFQGFEMLVPFCLAVSLLADLLDGMAARLLKVSSPIGKELDSLADMVSFGVLPSMLLYWMALQNQIGYSYESCLNNSTIEIPFGEYLVFILACFSALRLAKFNVDESQAESFIGLPTPAATVFVFGMFLAQIYQGVSFSIVNLLSVAIILSVLLVANIPMFSFKLKGFSLKESGWQYLFISLTIIAVICFKFVGVSVAVILYVLLNIIKNLLSKRT